MLKKTISTSVWSAQHPNAGRNIQQCRPLLAMSCSIYDTPCPWKSCPSGLLPPVVVQSFSFAQQSFWSSQLQCKFSQLFFVHYFSNISFHVWQRVKSPAQCLTFWRLNNYFFAEITTFLQFFLLHLINPPPPPFGLATNHIVTTYNELNLKSYFISLALFLGVMCIHHCFDVICWPNKLICNLSYSCFSRAYTSKFQIVILDFVLELNMYFSSKN